MVTIFMMSGKMATLGLLKINLFWNKEYDAIISAHDITNKILPRGSYYTVDVVMWPMFGNSMKKIIITSKDLTWKTTFLEGWSWFKFNNFGLALGMDLKFYASVAKGWN